MRRRVNSTVMNERRCADTRLMQTSKSIHLLDGHLLYISESLLMLMLLQARSQRYPVLIPSYRY